MQYFKPYDPLDPSKAHEIGLEMAEKLFPGYEVLVVTHNIEDHLHNHMIVNSVNFETGKKIHIGPRDLQAIKDLSDQICVREGLHVIIKDGQTPNEFMSMNEYQVTIRGESWKAKTMVSIDQSMDSTRSKEEFISAMAGKGISS